MNKTPRWPSGARQTRATESSDLKYMSSPGAGRVGEEVEADSLPRQERERFHKSLLSWSNSAAGTFKDGDYYMW